MFDQYEAPVSNNTYILDFKSGDINGDLISDSVYLVGQKTTPADIYADNIAIAVQDGRTNTFIWIPLTNAGGYNAQLFLGNFTSKQQLDILVNIDSGGSGGYIFAYLYTVRNNTPLLLFDSDNFNNNLMYRAVFLDNFKVAVSSLQGNLKFIIDVSGNMAMYLEAGVYDNNGKLLKPTEGSVLALGALYPLVNDYNGLYQLLAYQRIIGINNSDNLGAVQTYLKWNGEEIIAERVEVSIMPT